MFVGGVVFVGDIVVLFGGGFHVLVLDFEDWCVYLFLLLMILVGGSGSMISVLLGGIVFYWCPVILMLSMISVE